MTDSISLGRRRMDSFTGSLAGVMIVGTFTIPALGVLASHIIADLGLTRAQFGWVITGSAAVTAMMSPLSGRLADRTGGRRLTIGLSVVVAISSLLLGTATSLTALVLGGLVAGFANSAANPATNRLIASRLPVGRRGIVLGIKQSGVQLGFVLVGAALPAMAVASSWRVSLFAMAGFCGISALTFGWIFESDAGAKPVRPDAVPYRHARGVKWLTAYAVLMGAGGSSVSTFLPLYAEEALGFEPTMAGATMALVGVVGVISRVAVPRLAEARDQYVVPVLAMAWIAAAAIGFIVLASVGGARGLVWVGALAAGGSVVAWNAIVNLAAMAEASQESAGRATGLVNMGFMAGYLITPVTFGALVDRLGSYGPAWAATLGLYLLAAVVSHAWLLEKRRTDVHGSIRYAHSAVKGADGSPTPREHGSRNEQAGKDQACHR